jgi:hypothetical protein
VRTLFLEFDESGGSGDEDGEAAGAPDDRLKPVERLGGVGAAHHEALAEPQPAVGHLGEELLVDDPAVVGEDVAAGERPLGPLPALVPRVCFHAWFRQSGSGSSFDVPVASGRARHGRVYRSERRCRSGSVGVLGSSRATCVS